MKKKQYKKFEKTEQPIPPKKVKLEVYEDGLYIGTIRTEFLTSEEHPIDEQEMLEFVQQKYPARKKKYLTVKIV